MIDKNIYPLKLALIFDLSFPVDLFLLIHRVNPEYLSYNRKAEGFPDGGHV
jgi:hypothetical protein